MATSSSGQDKPLQPLVEIQDGQRDQAGTIVLMAQILNLAPVSQDTTVYTSARG